MSSRRLVLSGVSPRVQGLQWTAERLLRIGRLESLDVVLQDPSVGRRHAEVTATTDGWVVRDLGSGYATLINGGRVTGTERRLQLNDQVQCGSQVLRVTSLDDADSVPVAVPAAAPAQEPRSADGGLQIKTSGRFVKVQAIAQHSWERALEVVALDADRRPEQGRHLVTLLRAGYHLGHIASLDELLESILEDAVNALDAQRAAIVLADETTGQLQLRKVSNGHRPLKTSTRCYSKTLAERCFQQGQSLLCTDVQDDVDLQLAHSVAHGSMASIVCAVLRSPRKRLGVLHLDRGPLQEPFSREDFYLADAIAASVSVGIESAQMVERERDQFIQTVTALARTVELRDQYTANHTQRVTDYAMLIGHALQLSPRELHQLQLGTPLHDIGKIGIADAILRKPASLTADEFEQMKSHTLKGAAILETIPALVPMIPIVRHHHERWDGTGYPDGLNAGGIARVARVVAVADAFDAMTSDRPYRPALSLEVAFGELRAKAGSHFDPLCVQAFLDQRPHVETLVRADKVYGRLIEATGSIFHVEDLSARLVH